MFALDRLRALDALARTGSVARAATELRLTPSAVSQQLGKLDREAGAALTEPAGRGLRLTTPGRLLAGHAAEILAHLDTARTELDRMSDEVVGTLRMGAIPTSVHALAPPTIARLAREHPNLQLRLTDGEAEQTLPAVSAGDLDIAVVENWDGLPAPMPPGTTHARLCDDVIDLALPAHHRLADRASVRLAEVDDVDWVSDSPDNRCHQWLVQTLRAQNVEPRVTCTVMGFAMHLELVAGAGVAALIPRLARPPLPSGVRIVATDPVLRRTVDAVWRTTDGTAAVRTAVTVLTEVARSREPGAPSTGVVGADLLS